MKALLATTFALALLAAPLELRSQAPEYSAAPRQMLRLVIDAHDSAAVKKFLALDLDIAEFEPEQSAFTVIATAEQRNALTRLGLRYTVQLANLETFAQNLRAQDYLDSFHDYEETLLELQLAEAIYPALAKLEDIGDGWEKTQGLADRDIWSIKISDNVQSEEREPEVLIVGNHHAREIITPEIVLDFMNYLLENYGSDPFITHLINHRQIWLIPTLNPDGLDYVHHQDLWWRKNRRRNAGGSIGVDLNRNYEFKWGYDNSGSSPNGYSETFRGEAPFSEPETAALRDFVAAHHFRASLSYHSFGNLLIYPWGYVAQTTPDHASFAALADSMKAYHHYKAGLAVETVFYMTNGDSDDWLYGEQTTKPKIFALTPEVGQAFHPALNEIEKLVHENRGPGLFLTYAAGEEPIVAHEPLRDVTLAATYQIVAHVLPPIPLTAPVPLTRNQILLHYNTTGVPPYQTVRMTATGNNAEYAAEIPRPNGAQNIYYYISAADDSGRVGYAPRGASAGAHYSFTISTVAARETHAMPTTLTLYPNHPNPFRAGTTLSYEVPVGMGGEIKIAIYNLVGRQVRVLAQREHGAGAFRVNWEGKDEMGQRMPAGIYFCRLEGAGHTAVQKLLLVR